MKYLLSFLKLICKHFQFKNITLKFKKSMNYAKICNQILNYANLHKLCTTYQIMQNLHILCILHICPSLLICHNSHAVFLVLKVTIWGKFQDFLNMPDKLLKFSVFKNVFRKHYGFTMQIIK